MNSKAFAGVAKDHSLSYIPSTNLKYKMWPSPAPPLAKRGIWNTKQAMGSTHIRQLRILPSQQLSPVERGWYLHKIRKALTYMVK